MIYLDNAATGGFKPNAVLNSVETTLRYLCANPLRSGHRLAITGAKTILETRTTIAEFFNAQPDRVIFTKNCTEALNQAIFGSVKKGGHVITTIFEHNSVLRPLFHLQNKGIISLDLVAPSNEKTIVQAINEKICDQTFMIISTAVSNVTGYELPLKDIGELASKHGLIYLVDGAQGGGHIPLDIKELNISMLALAGHKGLYGIMGSGILILNNDIDLQPLIFGGTGTESHNPNMPDCYPERLEAGTINLPSVVSLLEGVKYVSRNLENFSNHLYNATSFVIEQLSTIPSVKIYSEPNRSGIVSFSISQTPSNEVADILNSEYDVAVRGGLHCAPLAHTFLGTEKDGLVRASIAVQNSSRELNYFISAIKKIAETKFS